MLRATALLPHPYDTSPSQRFRLEQWQRPLVRHGVELTLRHLVRDAASARGLQSRPPSVRAVASLLGATARRAAEVLAGRLPDVWIVHREATMIGPALLERAAARRAPVVFDFDDAIWLTAGGPRTLAERIRQPWKTDDILRLASGVSAGNQYLAEHAARFTGNVTVVPTTIDVQGEYRRQKVLDATKLYTVGWSGSASTAMYIRQLLPTLAAVAREVPFRLLVIGAAAVSYPGLDIECRPWRSTTEVEDLLEIDVGLMPLADDAWARGKCGLKALQYMALGIPAVISPVGVNAAIVADGDNGYLASTEMGWRRALVALRDPDARARMGARARATVHAHYSAESAAKTLADLLTNVRQSA